MNVGISHMAYEIAIIARLSAAFEPPAIVQVVVLSSTPS